MGSAYQCSQAHSSRCYRVACTGLLVSLASWPSPSSSSEELTTFHSTSGSLAFLPDLRAGMVNPALGLHYEKKKGGGVEFVEKKGGSRRRGDDEFIVEGGGRHCQ